jgi:hypothetical protein
MTCATSGRRTPKASMKIVVDMVHEKILTEREGLLRIDPIKCVSYFTQKQLIFPKESHKKTEKDSPDGPDRVGKM